MRVIFMGTPDFAVGTLEAIVRAGHEVVLVVSQPDKAVGRSKALKPTPVKECALSHGLSVYQPARIRDEESIAYLSGYQADIIIVVAFGQIIPKEILAMPRYCCVNVHASLLPRYRGAAPIQWAVINGDPVTGVTTQRMDEGLDTGDIIMEEEVNVREDETAGTLFDRLAEVGASLCVRTMEAIEAGTAQYTPQDHAAATHTAKIKKELGDIDWSDDAAHIECLIRGLDPWPSAYTSLSGRTLKIWRAEVVATAPADATAPVDGVAPGTICGVEKNRILVQTGNGILGITEVQPEGKKRMDVSSFLNGNPVAVGTKLERVTV